MAATSPTTDNSTEVTVAGILPNHRLAKMMSHIRNLYSYSIIKSQVSGRATVYGPPEIIIKTTGSRHPKFICAIDDDKLVNALDVFFKEGPDLIGDILRNRGLLQAAENAIVDHIKKINAQKDEISKLCDELAVEKDNNLRLSEEIGRTASRCDAMELELAKVKAIFSDDGA